MRKGSSIISNVDSSSLTIDIHHSGLYGKPFKDGAIKLLYILLWLYLFNYFLLFPMSHNFFTLFLTNIYHFIFSCIEMQFIFLILYSCFGFTRVSINKRDFLIEKSLWGIKRKIMGQTKHIVNAEIKPIEVFHRQSNSAWFFSGRENIPYACYLLKDNSEFAFGAMCSMENLNQMLLSINNYVDSNNLDLVK